MKSFVISVLRGLVFFKLFFILGFFFWKFFKKDGSKVVIYLYGYNFCFLNVILCDRDDGGYGNYLLKLKRINRKSMVCFIVCI